MTDAPTRERPIIFSAPMIRAIHAGRKTMTRRVLRLPTKTHTGGAIYERPDMGGWEPTTNGGGGCFTIGKSGERVPVPETVGIWHRTCGVCLDAPWQRGDILWVREAWTFINMQRRDDETEFCIGYPADGDDLPNRPFISVPDADEKWHDKGMSWWDRRKRSSRFMLRWSSRITLRVTDVRVERLQEISLADVLAEGAPIYSNYRDTT